MQTITGKGRMGISKAMPSSLWIYVSTDL